MVAAHVEAVFVGVGWADDACFEVVAGGGGDGCSGLCDWGERR